jgi:hypothetical protein
MNVQNLPNKGELLFLINRRVVVTKVYETFNLVKVKYLEDASDFVVDASALTNEADYTDSLTIRLFERDYDG